MAIGEVVVVLVLLFGSSVIEHNLFHVCKQPCAKSNPRPTGSPSKLLQTDFYLRGIAKFSRPAFPATERPDLRRFSEGVSEGVSEGFLKGSWRRFEGSFS